MRRMRALVVLVALLGFAGHAASADLRVTISQGLLDKVLDDVFKSGPYVVMDEEFPFDPDDKRSEGDDTTFAKVREALTAKRGRSPEETVLKEELDSIASDIETQLDTIDRLRKEASDKGESWDGPSQAETNELRKFDFPVRPHLAHAKVVIPSRPTIRLNGAKTPFSNLKTDVDLRIQLYWKNPFHQCTKKCCVLGLCVCCRWKAGWDKLDGRIPFSTSLVAEGTLNFIVADPLLVMRPEFSKLRIDHPIWGLIKLEGKANKAVKPIKIIDKRDIVLRFDDFGLRYVGDSLAVGGAAAELYLDVTVKRQ